MADMFVGDPRSGCMIGIAEKCSYDLVKCAKLLTVGHFTWRAVRSWAIPSLPTRYTNTCTASGRQRHHSVHSRFLSQSTCGRLHLPARCIIGRDESVFLYQHRIAARRLSWEREMNLSVPNRIHFVWLPPSGFRCIWIMTGNLSRGCLIPGVVIDSVCGFNVIMFMQYHDHTIQLQLNYIDDQI
jgi:hypothetical protein